MQTGYSIPERQVRALNSYTPAACAYVAALQNMLEGDILELSCGIRTHHLELG